MPRVVLPGAEAEKIVMSIKFEDLPKFVKSKSIYISWAVLRRLENLDCSMEMFLQANKVNNFHTL